MQLLFAPPSPDDLIRLLKAWRLWLLGAVAGALIGSLVYIVAPPPHRARASVNVDFHLEQAWPQNSDREQFYYLERETRKLQELSLSDTVLADVAAHVSGASIRELRSGVLELSQPGNGAWHFYATDRDARRAELLAAAWAQSFAHAVQAQVAQPSSALEQFITATPSQTQELGAARTVSMAVYMLAGALIVVALAGIGLLFLHRPGSA